MRACNSDIFSCSTGVSYIVLQSTDEYLIKLGGAHRDRDREYNAHCMASEWV
jgi:hypothetical protein